MAGFLLQILHYGNVNLGIYYYYYYQMERLDYLH